MVFLVQYDWLSNYRPILEMYWGNFGWLDTPLPVSLTLGLSWLTVIGVWSTLWWFVRRLALRSDPLSLFPLFFCGCATLGIIAFYAYLTFLIPYWGMQGRYMLPAVTAQMAWLLFGLVLPAPGNLRRAWMWIINTGMVVLNLFVLFSLLPLRYYGARNWLLLSDRATVLQPLEPTTLLVIFVVVVGLVALFLVTCALTLAQDPSVDLPSAE